MVDPITVSVLTHRFSAIVEEMGEAMLRTAYSQILNSSRDFSTAICDAQARLVAQADHVPIHVGAIPWAVMSVRDSSAIVQVGPLKGELVPDPDGGEFPSLELNDLVLVRMLEGNGSGLKFVLDPTPPIEGALVAIEPRTGFVKAMVGGYDFDRSRFNRVTQARRQPGSAFKPLVYAAALDRNFSMASVVVDSPGGTCHQPRVIHLSSRSR